jgi:hypothetical protein
VTSSPRLPRQRIALLTALAALAMSACTLGGPSGSSSPTPGPTPDPPRALDVTVVERGSGTALAGAIVESDTARVATDEAGVARLTARPGAPLRVEAAEHDAADAVVPEDGPLTVELRANVLRGTVTDDAGEPLQGVRIFVDGADASVRSDADGRYVLPDVPEGATVVYKRAGHRLGEIAITHESVANVALEPFEARALYAPAGIFASPESLQEMLDLLEATEANALVIDVKETEGQLLYATELPAAAEIGALDSNPILNLEELLPMLRERGIYTIARMVVMKDNTLTAARPELAVRNISTGEPWRDNLGGAWLDPAAPGVGEYVTAVASDLADKGFDEVQLDYIRFYSDGPYALADTNLPNTQPFRLPAIRSLLRMVSDALATKRAFLGADVFPISFILANDQGIGQRPDVVMPYVDYACPMVYPSHFGPGVFGFPVPNEHPYEVVDQTLAIMNEQAREWPVALRPWIQDFGYGEFGPYTAEQVRAEMDAAEARGASGWMIWNPDATFTRAALGPPVAGEDTGPVTTLAPVPSPSASP